MVGDSIIRVLSGCGKDPEVFGRGRTDLKEKHDGCMKLQRLKSNLKLGR
jgi:hypothetical protein